tara:strand:- start:56 stop:1435 length:1380 start_codon:yes stop_codon:yes gene_type:complete
MKKILLYIIIIIGIVNGQNSVVKQFSDSFADVAEMAKPAVVTIVTDKIISMQNFDEFGFFFYNPNSPKQKEFRTNALGSGVIIDSDNGYIMTNNHVVQDMDNIRVKLFDKREYDAKIVGTDPKTDLAILQIDAKDLKEVQLGNSDNIRVGEWVMAVGSPFSENLSHTVTTGIVSALGRSNIMNSQSYEDFIQTDAAINPGNSGGALLSMEGLLIGINTAIATGGYERSNRGVGFAIPSNMAARIMDDLINKGYVTRSWLGVLIQELDNETAEALELNTRNGALITDVLNDSPAMLGGIEEGDVIIEFDGKKIENTSNLKNVVSLTAPDSKSIVKVVRNGREKNISVVLKELPENPERLAIIEQNQSNEFGFELKKINRVLKEKYELNDDDALVVIKIDPSGEAFQKGIREGDIIKRVGTKKVTKLSEFNKLAEKSRSKGTLLLLVKKPNGSSKFFTLNY